MRVSDERCSNGELIPLSIVVPAYNESLRLPGTLDRLLSYFRENGPSPVDIVVVDDGSTDNTAEIVRRYGERDAQIRLIQNPGNRGKGYAVRNGMLAAKGEWVLFSDADLSAPIEELPKLMEGARRAGAAVAFGSRALDRSLVKVSQPASREVAGRMFNMILRKIVGLPYKDTQCGFKLFRADAAREIFSRQLLDGFSFDVEDLVIARRLGFTAVEIPVVWRNVEGTKVTLRHGLKSFADLIRIRRNEMLGRYGATPI